MFKLQKKIFLGILVAIFAFASVLPVFASVYAMDLTGLSNVEDLTVSYFFTNHSEKVITPNSIPGPVPGEEYDGHYTETYTIPKWVIIATSTSGEVPLINFLKSLGLPGWTAGIIAAFAIAYIDDKAQDITVVNNVWYRLTGPYSAHYDGVTQYYVNGEYRGYEEWSYDAEIDPNIDSVGVLY